MMRVLLALMLALGIWAGLATWGVWVQRGANATLKAELAQNREALKTAQAARKRSEAALVSARRKNAATASAAASTARSLSAATAANPDWASQPVPKEVQDAFK